MTGQVRPVRYRISRRVRTPFSIYPNALLLAAQLLGVVVFPFTSTEVGQTFFSLFQMGVLVLAVAAVRPTPSLSTVSMLIGAPAIVLTLVSLFMPEQGVVAAASDVTHFVFYGYLAYGLLRYMFADREVTTDEWFATGSCFTVVAWSFAYLYSAVQNIWGAEQFSHAGEGALDWMEMLFLSFTTMTGTGLSDISPVGDVARSVVMLEQFAGTFYIGVVVARVLTLTMSRFKPGDRA